MEYGGTWATYNLYMLYTIHRCRFIHEWGSYLVLVCENFDYFSGEPIQIQQN
jgi:hypothetical protein